MSNSAQDVSLRELTSVQWKSGLAAWLGWLFDGLDMHLYTLVAMTFVAELMHVSPKDPSVAPIAGWIQGAFLVGWALGGAFFGRIGDRLGRSRALMLTILTYALFTGLSYFAQNWQQLMLFRFLAALGIGGEWAVGAALLAESWPRKWRAMLAAVLQSAVNIGILLAGVVAILLRGHTREIFLVGILPAFLVLWIRKAVPEPEEWHAAQLTSEAAPSVFDLFRGSVRKITLLTMGVCGLALTAHWAFMFWNIQHLRGLPETAEWTQEQRDAVGGTSVIILMVSSIIGNFVSGVLAQRIGFKKALVVMLSAYGALLLLTYSQDRHVDNLMWVWFPLLGGASGVFSLFTMYMPPLFPVLLRTTGAGFCYNIGRILSAVGTVALGVFSRPNSFGSALFYAGILFFPAALLAAFLPEHEDVDPVRG